MPDREYGSSWNGRVVMTVVLDGDGRTTIDRRPVTVAVTGLPPNRFRLVVLDGRQEAFGVIRQRPGVVVLPRVDRPLTVRLEPVPSGEFAAGTALAVRVSTEATRDSAGDEVLVESVDVSGLPLRDVIVIDVVDRWRLSITANQVVRDEPLGPLAGAARAAARAHLRDATPEPVHVLIAVDTSASMAPLAATRGVEAVVDLVAGISQVIGTKDGPSVFLLADGPPPLRPLPAVPIRELAAATRSAIDGAGTGCSFRSAPVGLPIRSPSLTYVITDAVPADVAALRTPPDSADRRHLVLLADGGEPDPPEAAGVPITKVLLPRGGPDTPTRLSDENDQRELSQLVGSLLTGVLR